MKTKTQICLCALGCLLAIFAAAIAWKTYTTTVLDWNGILVSYDKSTPFIIEQFNTDKLQLSFTDFSPAGSIIFMRRKYGSMEHLRKSMYFNEELSNVHVQFDGDNTSIAKVEFISKGTGYYSQAFVLFDKGFICGFMGPRENFPLFAPTLLDAVHGN